MKLKFYMRGIGIGIIFSSIVFFLFFSSYNKISDEEIIKRAKELGMVQADDGVNELDKLLAASKGEKKDTTPTPVITEIPKEEENIKNNSNEDTSNEDTSNGEISNEDMADEDILENTSDDNLSIGDTSKNDVESENSNEELEEESDLPKMIEVEIEEGQGAKQIAKLLEEKGIISDYSDFNKYLKSLGYTKSLLSGKFHIREGADYSEIIKILVFK